MKKIIIGICSVLTIIIVVLILFTVQGRSIRQTELDNAVTSSLEKTMSMLSADSGLAPSSNEELAALFVETLAVQISSKSALNIEILEVDVEKGLLSVEVDMKYNHPIGTTGTVSCAKTIMLEQYYDIDVIVEQCKVDFYSEGILYKGYTLPKGSDGINPGTPVVEGKTFLHWKDTETGEIVNLSTLVVDKDMILVAVFN